MRYGGVVAVDDVSLRRSQPGEVVGLIGPNGAGKTTLIDAVTGFCARRRAACVLDDMAIDRLVAAPARRGRGRALVPVARAVRGHDRAAKPAGGAATARDFGCLRHRPGVARRTRRCRDDGRGVSGVRPRGRPRPHARRAPLRPAAAARDRPRGRRRGRRVLLLDEPAAGLDDIETAELGRPRAPPRRRVGDRASCSSSTTSNFVMRVCDESSCSTSARKIAEGTPSEVRSDPAVIAAYLGEHDDAHVGPAPRRRGHEDRRQLT